MSIRHQPQEPLSAADISRLEADQIAADQEQRLAGASPEACDIPAPAEAAWHTFVRELSHARAVATDVSIERAHRAGAQLAMMAVIDLLKVAGNPAITTALASPFQDVLWALADAESGVGSALFAPILKTSKPNDSLRVFAIKQTAVLAVEELREAGDTLEQAYRRAARDLAALGIKAGGDATLATTVAGWRERLSKPARLGRLAKWREQYGQSRGSEGSPRERADFLLTMLKTGDL